MGRGTSWELTAIKLLHTSFWLAFVTAIVYILYCSIYHISNVWLALSVALVLGEGVVLVLSGGICPLTRVAKRYSANHDPGFDIFLPAWLLRRHKLILGTIFVVGLILNLARNISW